ncbi:MAG: interleukin-like EMT inducer domain-containing protein [Anaerolineae bacterium]
MKVRVPRDLRVLLAYLALALVLTYPLVLQFTTHVAGDGSDDPALAWNLWWVPHALIDLGRNPIYTDYMFYPIGLNLAFYTLTYLNAFIAVPIQYVWGLVPAANMNLLLSFTLSGFGTYLLVKYLLRGESPAGAPPTPGPFSRSAGEGEKDNGRHRAGEGEKDSGRRRAEEAEKSGGRETGEGERVPLAHLLAAFAAGLLYAFSSNKFLYASLGQFNIASSHWIPFYILFLVRLLPPRRSAGPSHPSSRLRDGFFLGLFLLFQALSEFIFASFLILFSAAYLVYWLLSNRSRISHSSFLIRNLLVAALVFVIPMSPILAAMFSDMQTEGDFIQSGLGFSNIFSGDLLGFIIPSHLHPLLGGLEAQFHFPYINFVYLGVTAIVLALIALWRVPRARIWGLWFALVFFVTLGPTLRVNGAEYNLPFLPFNLLLQIPLIKGNRYPSRWGVMLTLCLAIMVGYGVAWLLQVAGSRLQVPGRRSQVTGYMPHVTGYRRQGAGDRLRPETCDLRLVACGLGLAALLVFEHLSLPLPTSDFRVPEIYQSIAREPGDFTVMELPLTWRNGFRVTGSYRADSQGPIDRAFMLAQWYQTVQGHPILNGNTSRNPELKFQYFAETPVLDSLIAIQTGHAVDDATRARDRTLAPRLLQFLNVRYIIWHTPYEEANRDVANRTRAYVEQVLPVTKVSESYENGKGTVVYRVQPMPASDTQVVKPDDPLARLYFGEGWSVVGQDRIWAERDEVRLFFSLSTARRIRLTIPFIAGPGSPDVGMTINGHALPADPPAPAWHVVVKDVPADYLQAGVNEVRLHFNQFLPLVPADSPQSRLPIGQTGATSPVSVVVRSAGEEQGNFGHIFVQGVDESPNERGYNLIVMDPQTGHVEARANFDTLASAENSTRLADWLAAVPDGKIVAVAVADEASLNLTGPAVEALRSIGAQEDLRGKFRWSHAIIGVKGALPGTALEAASETRVSQLVLGIGATNPRLGPDIREVDVEPIP